MLIQQSLPASFSTIEAENVKYSPSQPSLQLGHGRVTQSWATGLEWKCERDFWEGFCFLMRKNKQTNRARETLGIVMERRDAWSCSSHLITKMWAELRIKVPMLKMSQQKDGRRIRGLYDIVDSCRPNSGTLTLETLLNHI